jgi:uncharacterized protein involved in exopolysaccharide biosynthesis
MADAQPQDATEPSTRERIERGKVLALRARRYWKGAFAVFVVVSAIAVFLALQLKRIYASECVVLVKPNLKTEEQESQQEKAVRLAPKLRDTLLTRSRLEPIIKEYKLYPQTVENRSMVDAVDEMTKHIGFKGRDSETFVISFEDEDPDRARAITQRLAETTMDDFRRANMNTSQQQADFLSSELARSEKDLEEANRALASFLASHPEFASDAINSPFSPRNQAGSLPPTAAMPSAPSVPSSTDPQLATLFRQKARLEVELKAAGQVSAPPPNETLTSLTHTRDEAAKRAAQAQADLADKRTKLTDQHPDMIAAKAQAEAAASSLRTAEAQLEAAKKAQAGAAPAAGAGSDLQSKLADLNHEIAARQSEIARGARPATPAPTPASGSPAEIASAALAIPIHPVVLLETEWARLLRAVGDARGAQEDLHRRSERARLKASATEVASTGSMEIIDAAYKPTSPKKGRRPLAMAGLALAFLAAVAYAAARVLLNDTIYDPADVQALKLIPVLGVIPRLPPVPSSSGQGSTAMQPHNQGPQGVSPRAG